MIRTIVVAGAVFFGLPAVAGAQSEPVVAASPAARPAGASSAWMTRGGAFALQEAYRSIAAAQVAGTSAYLDAAKRHYRSAIERYGRHDAGATSEAMAAAALARAAMADHPAPAPRDIPTPPAIAMSGPPAGGGPRGATRRPMAGPMGPGGPGPMGGGPMPGGPGGVHRGRGGHFDATAVANEARLANTPEAKDLAQKAVDADVAQTHAAFSGNLDEAMRQGRLANDLAMAVRSLAGVDHPPTFRRRTVGGAGS